MARFRMKTATDVRRALNRVSNMVANGELDTKSANAIIYAANSILSCIRMDEYESKLRELEGILESMTAKRQ